MVRELVLWKSGVPIFQPSGGKGREQISAKVMSSSWTKNESSYNIICFYHISESNRAKYEKNTVFYGKMIKNY